MSYQIIKTDVSITLHGHTYLCDLVLGQYASNFRPAILLVDASSIPDSLGEMVATASINAPAEYLYNIPNHHFPVKVWSENAGLWEQLLSLTDDKDRPLFHSTNKALTLNFVRAPVVELGVHPLSLFNQLSKEVTQ